MAETKYINERDGEVFNYQLANLNTLKNYGGNSDLALIKDYLQSFSATAQQQAQKLAELFELAFNFVNDSVNWVAISKLAHYILNSNKLIIGYEEVASLVEN